MNSENTGSSAGFDGGQNQPIDSWALPPETPANPPTYPGTGPGNWNPGSMPPQDPAQTQVPAFTQNAAPAQHPGTVPNFAPPMRPGYGGIPSSQVPDWLSRIPFVKDQPPLLRMPLLSWNVLAITALVGLAAGIANFDGFIVFLIPAAVLWIPVAALSIHAFNRGLTGRAGILPVVYTLLSLLFALPHLAVLVLGIVFVAGAIAFVIWAHTRPGVKQELDRIEALWVPVNDPRGGATGADVPPFKQAPLAAKWPSVRSDGPVPNHAALATWLWLGSGVVLLLTLVGPAYRAFVDNYSFSFDGGAGEFLGDLAWLFTGWGWTIVLPLVVPVAFIVLALRYRRGAPSAWSWSVFLTGLVFVVALQSVITRMGPEENYDDGLTLLGLAGLIIAALASSAALGLSLTPAARAHAFGKTRSARAPMAVIAAAAAWFFGTGIYVANDVVFHEVGAVHHSSLNELVAGYGDDGIIFTWALTKTVLTLLALALLGVVRAFAQGSAPARSFLAFAAVLIGLSGLSTAAVSMIDVDSGMGAGSLTASFLAAAVVVGATIASFTPPVNAAFASHKGTANFLRSESPDNHRLAAIIWGISAFFGFIAFTPFLGWAMGYLDVILEDGTLFLIIALWAFAPPLFAVLTAYQAFRLFNGHDGAKGVLNGLTVLYTLVWALAIILLIADADDFYPGQAETNSTYVLMTIATLLAIAAFIAARTKRMRRLDAPPAPGGGPMMPPGNMGQQTPPLTPMGR